MEVKVTICIVVISCWAIYVFREFFFMIEDYDTTMQIRKGLLEAKKLYKEKYEFKPRLEPVVKCNEDLTLDFTQFKGRL